MPNRAESDLFLDMKKDGNERRPFSGEGIFVTYGV